MSRAPQPMLATEHDTGETSQLSVPAARPEAEPLKVVSLPDGTLSLEQFALPQINQCQTATCHYNAVTGIMEILYAQRAKKKIDISEPYVLACAPEFDGTKEWFWKIYDGYDMKSTGVVSEQELSHARIYPYYNNLLGSQSIARRCVPGLADKKQSLGFKLKSTPLFFHANWGSNTIVLNQVATAGDLQKVTTWFRANKKPVNLHHLYNGIWHSVILIGHRPAIEGREEQLLIKDSLGEAGVGKWVSAEAFRQTLYGAIAITDVSDP